MYLPSAIAQQPQINAAIAQIIDELAPHVLHIRCEMGRDWNGDGAIFFRVLLSDEGSSAGNLRDVTSKVVWKMSEKVDFPSIGLFPYYNFRSQSEQAEMQEPAWA
jgi:hypothetical protein